MSGQGQRGAGREDGDERGQPSKAGQQAAARTTTEQPLRGVSMICHPPAHHVPNATHSQAAKKPREASGASSPTSTMPDASSWRSSLRSKVAQEREEVQC